jgi:hypothetical protein
MATTPTATTTTPTPSSSVGLGYASAASSVVSSVANALLSTKATEQRLENETRAKKENMDAQVKSFASSTEYWVQDMKRMDDSFTDVMTERGLQQMKEEATARTAMAESGTSGGTTDNVIHEAYLDSLLDEGIISQQRNNEWIKNLVGLEQAKLSVDASIDSIVSGGTTITSNPISSGLAGGINSFNTILSGLDNKTKADLFNFQTKQTDTE